MREFTGRVARGLQASSSDELPLWFATFTHASLAAGVPIVNDVVDYFLDSVRYFGAPFDLQFITDADTPPRGRLTVQNADRRIGEWFRQLDEPPRIRLRMISLGEFGDVDPVLNARLPLGTPNVEIDANFLRAFNVEVNYLEVSMEIESFDLTSSPCPPVRATSTVLPGLHWR